MKKFNYDYPLLTLFIGLVLIGLYFGVVQLREWANPEPNMAVASLAPLVKAIDQQPYNDKVIIENRIYVAEVDLAWPGFVAVYENPYDKYGTLVGTSRFLPAGKYQYVSVDLVKVYKPGQRLYVILHKDTGDGIYNLVQDPVVKNKKGFEVADSFIIREGGFGHGK